MRTSGNAIVAIPLCPHEPCETAAPTRWVGTGREPQLLEGNQNILSSPLSQTMSTCILHVMSYLRQNPGFRCVLPTPLPSFITYKRTRMFHLFTLHSGKQLWVCVRAHARSSVAPHHTQYVSRCVFTVCLCGKERANMPTRRRHSTRL